MRMAVLAMTLERHCRQFTSSYGVSLAHVPDPDLAWQWALMCLHAPHQQPGRVLYLCDEERRPKNLGKYPLGPLNF